MNGTWGVGEVVATSTTATLLDNATLPSPSATAVTQVWPHFQLFPGWQSWQIDENTTFTLPIDMRFNDGHRVSIVAYSILMLLSAVGNFTVLSILVRRRRGARSTNINTMLIHLAIADLLVTFLLMPCEIAWSATVMWWAGDAWCRIMAFFRTFGLFQSSFVLVCISIDRYFAVLKPMNLSNDRRGKIMLSCAWIGSVLCSLPQMLVFRVQAHPFVPWFEQCITIWFAQDAKTPSTQEFMYFVFGMLMMYCLPFFVILFCYASILGEIYRRSREAKGDRFRRSSLGFLGKAKGRTLKMTVIIVVVFFICWTPYYFMSLWHFFDHKGSQKVDQKLQKGLYIFACTNSCMNPIVYGAFNIRPRRTDRRGVGGGAGGVGGQRVPIHQLSDDSIQISRLSSTVSNGSQMQRNDTKQSVVFSNRSCHPQGGSFFLLSKNCVIQVNESVHEEQTNIEMTDLKLLSESETSRSRKFTYLLFHHLLPL